MTSDPSTSSAELSYSYVGEELDLFSHAVNWKRYWASEIEAYMGNDVLEVGAGTGTNTLSLISDRQQRWVCLEPDATLAARLESKVQALKIPPGTLQVLIGDTVSLPAESSFDTILYIDVLEHIEFDQQEMERAFQLLAPAGHLIVLSPAHPFLYSTFDQGIGHFRRYSRRTLRAAGPQGSTPLRLFYLDSVGLLASLTNKLFLKQKLPTLAQIQFWDRYLVRTSLRIDPLLGFNLGKTVIGIWKKT